MRMMSQQHEHERKRREEQVAQTASCDDPGGTVDASGSHPSQMKKIRASTIAETNSGIALNDRPITERVPISGTCHT